MKKSRRIFFTFVFTLVSLSASAQVNKEIPCKQSATLRDYFRCMEEFAEPEDVTDEILEKKTKLPKELQWTAPFYAIKDISKEEAKKRADLYGAPVFETKDHIRQAQNTTLVRVGNTYAIKRGKALDEYRVWVTYKRKKIAKRKGRKVVYVWQNVKQTHRKFEIDRGYLLPRAYLFFNSLANIQYSFTHRPYVLSSLVRDKQKQRQLIEAGYPAASPDGPQQSTHLRGPTGDLMKRYMSQYQVDITLRLLKPFVQDGDIRTRAVNVYLEKGAIHIEGPITEEQYVRAIRGIQVAAYLIRLADREYKKPVALVSIPVSVMNMKCNPLSHTNIGK